jgi:hypothetical protein
MEIPDSGHIDWVQVLNDFGVTLGEPVPESINGLVSSDVIFRRHDVPPPTLG